MSITRKLKFKLPNSDIEYVFYAQDIRTPYGSNFKIHFTGLTDDEIKVLRNWYELIKKSYDTRLVKVLMVDCNRLHEFYGCFITDLTDEFCKLRYDAYFDKKMVK